MVLAVGTALGTAHGGWRLGLQRLLPSSVGTAASIGTSQDADPWQWWSGHATKSLVTLEAMARFFQHLSRSVMSSPKVVEEHPGAVHGMLFH